MIIPKEAKWLYTENQTQVERKLAGKTLSLFHHNEVMTYFKRFRILFLRPMWVLYFACAGLVLLPTSIIMTVITLLNFNPRTILLSREPNVVIALAFALFLLLPMSLAFLYWAWNALPYLKYPTVLERHYHQLMDKGKLHQAYIIKNRQLDEEFQELSFSLSNPRIRYSYQTMSPNAKTLQEGDIVLVLKYGDYAIVL